MYQYEKSDLSKAVKKYLVPSTDTEGMNSMAANLGTASEQGISHRHLLERRMSARRFHCVLLFG